jgi:hypothetical protein
MALTVFLDSNSDIAIEASASFKMEAEAKQYGKPLEAAWRDSAREVEPGQMTMV